MKQHHLISLLQANYVTVQVKFVRPAFAPTVPSSNKLYTYKTSLPVVEGDFAVVEVKNELTIVKVMKVDTVPQIDVDADYSYKWLVQRVDRTAYDNTLAVEQNFEKAITAAEREHQRAILKEKLSTHLAVGSEARRMFDNAVLEIQQLGAKNEA